MHERRHSLEQTADGLVRFAFGLGKKVLLADTLGRIADSVFAHGGVGASTATAWLGLVCYTFQIFFDFSGYSDMAIGLGAVFGLPLPENFRQPYRATSLTDFWRRWHITLSTWFRDYLYIPLGGNRRGAARTLVHLIAVAVVCGLWHGAAYTYMAWGLYHGVLLAIERVLRTKWNVALPAGHGARAVTLFLVMIGWVLFRADSLPEAFTYLKVLFGLASDPDPLFPLRYYLTSNHALILAVAALVALWPEAPPRLSVSRYVRPLAALAVSVLALIAQAPQTFNPFIYFQF